MSGLALVHATKAERVEAILREGLRTGMAPELTLDAPWTLDWYEANPIFVAFADSPFMEHLAAAHAERRALVEVDAHGLDLVADLAALVDTGARVGEGYLDWPRGRAPEALRPFMDEAGGIEIEHLIDPRTDACAAAIRVTRTAALLADVPPERLSRLPDLCPPAGLAP